MAAETGRSLALPRHRSLPLPGGGRSLPLIMGIVNVNRDSFFAGSRAPGPREAVQAALDMVNQGADIIDFGAESTRPGSIEIDPRVELDRLLPALSGFRAASDAVVSIDTRHPEVAKATLDAGADIINDIEGLARPGMADVIARARASVVIMHMRGTPATMQDNPEYADCGAEVLAFLRAAAARAVAAGIPAESIILDPGIGFGKRQEHNIALLKGIDRIAALGYPVLIGVSRKRLIGELTGREIADRLSGSLGAALAAWRNGADILRVHDVRETIDALTTFSEVLR